MSRTSAPEDRPGVEAGRTVPARLLPILARASTVDDDAPTVLEALAESLGWEVAALWLVDRSIDRLRCQAVWHPPGMALARFEPASRRLLLPKGMGLPGRVWEEAAPVWVSDVGVDRTLTRSAFALADGLAACFAFPVTSGTRFVGVIELWSTAVRRPDPDLLEAMLPIGAGLGMFLERWQIEADRDVLHDRLTFLAAASEALAASLDLDETLTAMADLAVPRLADWCVVHVADADGRPQPVAVAHVEASKVALVRELYERYPPDDDDTSIIATVIRTGKPVIYDEITDDAMVAAARDEGHLALLRKLELHSLLVLPLNAHGRRLGSLTLANEPGRHVTGPDRSLAEDLARRAAQAVDNARLYREMQATTEALRLQTALLTTQAEAGMEGMLVASPTGQMLSSNRRFAEMWGMPEQVMAGGLDDEALAQGARQVVDPEAFLARVRELYANPLAPSRDEVAFTDGRVFDRYGAPLRSDDGAYLGWAWYFRDITDRKRSERELQESGERFASLARTLQQSLLPPDLPNLPGVELAARYRPAGTGGEVGGDFYDVFRIGRGSWGVVMGDVCGKGAQAATLTALSRYTVRAAAVRTNVPSKVLATLNQAMFREAGRAEPFGDERFATVVYATVRRTRQRLVATVACGGHAPPLLVRPDATVTPLGHPGTLLGLFRSVDLSDTEVELQPGDALVMFTDGVTEAPGPGGQFGDERLAELLASLAGHSAADIAASIEATVMGHQGGLSRDDMAILVLRVPT